MHIEKGEGKKERNVVVHSIGVNTNPIHMMIIVVGQLTTLVVYVMLQQQQKGGNNLDNAYICKHDLFSNMKFGCFNLFLARVSKGHFYVDP